MHDRVHLGRGDAVGDGEPWPGPHPGSLAARHILGIRVDATSYEDAVGRILGWARAGESRYVCVAAVHLVMEAHDDPELGRVVNASDLVTPDGVPLVWSLKLLGVPTATRVCGRDLTLAALARAAASRVPVGFYGGTPETLSMMLDRLSRRLPDLRVGYACSPPFRALSESEETALVRAIAASGVRLLFVGLGCPKQERWMARQKGRLDAVMVGVGAAFDFIAGTKPQAPRVLQRAGLEWCFRLATEPTRLWYRYLYHNPRFVAHFACELVRAR